MNKLFIICCLLLIALYVVAAGPTPKNPPKKDVKSNAKDVPKKEAPKKEAPKKEAPKKEAPKKEVPKKDTKSPAKSNTKKHIRTSAEIIDGIMLTVAREAGKASGATVTNELGAIFKFIAGNHPAAVNAVNAVVLMSRDPNAKVPTDIGKKTFGSYPEYKSAAKQLDNLAKSSASAKTVAAFIPIALARPNENRWSDAEKYVKEATKDKNAKPGDVANSLFKQQKKHSLNFVTRVNEKWVVDGSIAAMLVASGGDMTKTAEFNDNLAKSHNSYLKDTNNVAVVI